MALSGKSGGNGVKRGGSGHAGARRLALGVTAAQRQRGKAVLANARSTASRQRAKCNGGVTAAYRKAWRRAVGESVQMAAAYRRAAGMRWRIAVQRNGGGVCCWRKITGNGSWRHRGGCVGE
jgi:hypothetical protein